MKKKRDSAAAAATTTTTTTTTANSDPISNLKTLIRDHAVFFDNLVDLIPARFYLSSDNQDKPWFQGLPKDAKQAAKRLSKENTKKSRRDRLDPDLASSKTTNQVLKESLESEKSGNDSNLSVGGGGGEGGGGERVSVTYEELQMRLRKRLEELRAGRGGGGGGDGGGGGGQRREKKEGSKRKRSEEEKKRESERNVIDKEASEAALDIEFGKVKLRAGVDDGSLNKKKKKRKLSKEEELERAIKLEEAKKDPEKGETVAKQHSWKAATERAMGKKVHDNPKLLKESMKKEKKKHKKSVEKWKERVEKTESMKREKQDKRKGNIQAKIDRKKQMKIEKREKKLMRPGFEGRKEGFVNAN